MIARGVRDDVVLRQIDPPLPPRPVVAALPAGYRSPAAAAMLDVLHEVVAEWQAEAPEVGRVLAAAR
jgi:DNA-binding transcriptional LysR family regulator